MRAWTPPPAGSAEGASLPEGSTWFLDGRQIATVPVLSGLHIVQRRTGDTWESRVLDGERFPSEWSFAAGTAPAPVAVDASVSWSVGAAVLGGYVARSQSVDEPGNWLADDASGKVAVRLASAGRVGFGAVGLWWDAAAPLTGFNDPTTSAWGGASVAAGPVIVDVGAGVRTVGVTTAAGGQTFAVVQPRLGVAGTFYLGAVQAEPSVFGAWSPAATGAGARLAALFGSGFARPEVALEAGWLDARFRQDGSERDVGAVSWHGGLRVGVRLGSKS